MPAPDVLSEVKRRALADRIGNCPPYKHLPDVVCDDLDRLKKTGWT